jgi:hypothetical protein
MRIPTFSVSPLTVTNTVHRRLAKQTRNDHMELEQPLSLQTQSILRTKTLHPNKQNGQIER